MAQPDRAAFLDGGERAVGRMGGGKRNAEGESDESAFHVSITGSRIGMLNLD